MAEEIKNEKKKNWFVRHKVLTVILALIVLGIISSATNGSKFSNSTTNSNSTDSTSSKTEDKKSEPTPTSENKKPDAPVEYTSALYQATTYANTMHLSKQGVYDQLVSQYGGKFSPEAAQYAIDNVKADWNANALAQAKTYQNTMHLSPAAVRDQLVSAYGGKFTAAEADYAIAHLND
jgi:septal ring-binding cell division protein DamX